MFRRMIGDDSSLTLRSNVDMARLAPCQDSLLCHSRRVNYRLACYKAADPTFTPPSPIGKGWLLNGQIIEPEWNKGPIMPISLVDIAEETAVNINELSDEIDEPELDFGFKL